MNPIKRAVPVFFIAASIAGCALECSTSSHFSARAGFFRAGLDTPHVLRTGDGKAVLGLVIEPPAAGSARREPIALSLVIDHSGSMSGEKIEHARFAARSLIESLTDGDEVSVIQFDDHNDVIVPNVVLDAKMRPFALTTVGNISIGGGTSIGPALKKGLEVLGAAHSKARRLVLLSDGQDGSTPQSLVASLPAVPGATVSTIGIGTDYAEAVMMAVAQYGAGEFHHLTDPVQMAKVLSGEMARARSVAYTAAFIEIRPRAGVTILDDPALALTRQGGGVVRVPVGVLYAGEKRSIAVPIQVPVGGAGEGDAASVRLVYQAQGGGAEVASELAVRYELTSSADESARGVPELMVAADRLRVAHALGDAAALIQQGDLVEAQAILRDERARLEKRREHLSGTDRTEMESLVGMLRDPYVDADLGAHDTGTKSAAAAQNQPANLDALVERARTGQPLAGAESDLATLGGADLRMLRNVSYARHGYQFKSSELDTAFHRFNWYKPDAAFDEKRFTSADVDNIALVRSFEGRATLVTAVQSNQPARPAADVDALVHRALAGRSLGPNVGSPGTELEFAL